MATKTGRHPWEQGDKETAEAFEAFLLYRNTPRGHRSYQKVSHELGKSDVLISRWGKNHRWIMRVQAWDDYQLQVEDEAYTKALKDMAIRHAQTAVLMQNKVIQRLAELDPAKLSVQELLEMLKEAVKMERVARGEPGTIKGVQQRDAPTSPTCKLYADVDFDAV